MTLALQNEVGDEQLKFDSNENSIDETMRLAEFRGNQNNALLVSGTPENANTTLKIGGRGAGSGLIFYIDGDNYLECSELLGSENWNDALALAKNYEGGGYDDWYLPTKEKLNYIYENLRVQGFISDTGWFWSSSEQSSSYAWNQNFGRLFIGGVQGHTPKGGMNEVFAIRSFPSDGS